MVKKVNRRNGQILFKRIFDIVVAVFALILLSPIILLIAIAIKIDDKGPVLYVQDRVGKEGEDFRCYKFRSMVVGAENKGKGINVTEDDTRITIVGQFLRRFSLDEIPQLINVIKGEMSIVGPRPTVPKQVAYYTPWQRRRLEVKPGMAGWAWIHGRNNIPWAERVELDIWYIDNWSFSLDVKILLKAFLFLLQGRGLYRPPGTPTGFDFD